jgi:serine/threonine protein phosphatase PrpC
MAGPLQVEGKRWRWAAASCIGTSHLRKGTRKQDALRCVLYGDGNPVLCAIVCDGAGSAPFGGEGASVICRILSSAVREHFATTSSLPDDESIWSWIDRARDRLGIAAERKDVRRQAFASTLVMMLAAPEEIAVVHVGDGAAVARDLNGGWHSLSWPQNGEYASTTYFLTDDPSPRVRITRTDASFDAYALFSDGIEDLALDHRAAIAHEPFFRTMIAPLDRSPVDGRDKSLSESLGGFLNSARVCERTDDDKSLILISLK